MQAIAFVYNDRQVAIDDNWRPIVSQIKLADEIPTESLMGIESFSHLEIIYYFDKAADADIVFSGRPRGNTAFPVMGIFAQRKKDRPNHIGTCIVELIAVEERSLLVQNLDAINGTPVLDIKPVFREFQPTGSVNQPAWVAELMKNYW